jgi:hypothetical protein
MNISNKYCKLSLLSDHEVAKLVQLMPEGDFFDFGKYESYIGFSQGGLAGTWGGELLPRPVISYKEMLSLLGFDDKLVPHVHQKEIIAWAKGEEIEVRGVDDKLWHPCFQPLWSLPTSYRVKPKLTPTQLRIKELTEELVKLKEQDDVECGIDKVMGS